MIITEPRLYFLMGGPTSPNLVNAAASTGARAFGIPRTPDSFISLTTQGPPGHGISRFPFDISAGSTRWHAMGMCEGPSIAGKFLVRGGGAISLCAALLTTASLAHCYEQRTRAGRVVGAPLVCFSAFSILSNLRLVPATHMVYELCWSFLLPLSLSTIILGNPAIATEQSRSWLSLERRTDARASMGPMARMGLLFAVGTTGSIVGAAAAFRLATASVKALAISRETAAQVAGAITATYVGGSVNFFAVASAVGLREAGDRKGGSLLGALAAADILLMAIYFSGLFAAHRAPLLRRVFPGEGDGRHERTRWRGEAGATKDSSTTQRGNRGEGVGVESHYDAFSMTLQTMAVSGAICNLASFLAKLSPLPGTSTIIVAFLSMLVARVLHAVAPVRYAGMVRTAPAVSTTSLNIFFASVGASGLWTQVVGVAPPIFMFSLVALVIHVVFIIIVAAILNRVCGTTFGLDDMIVASNANIGGPSTAAAFAGLIGQDPLVIPAAVWGTIGYAVATTLGIGMWQALR